jgi:hypothetical protein
MGVFYANWIFIFMKIIITESQYKKIISEQPESVMDRRLGIQDRNMKSLGMNPSNTSDIKKYSEDVYGKPFTGHQVAAMLQIGTAFIPVVGPFISAGIGFLEAKSYWDEGDKQSAGITAALSTIPLLLEIPGVKQLTGKMISSIVTKIKNGGKGLTAEEQVILKSISDNESKITPKLKSVGIKLNGVVNEVKSLKTNFIKKFGQEKYDNLLKDFISGKIDKETFIKNLKLKTLKPSSAMVSKGITMSVEEFNTLDKLIPSIKSGKEIKTTLEVIKDGNKQQITIVIKPNPNSNNIAKAGLDNNWNSMIEFNSSQLKKMSDSDIKQTIYHEVTHIKDPIPQFLKQNKKGDWYVTGSGTQYADEATELYKKQIQPIKQRIKNGEPLQKEYQALMNKYNKLFNKYQFSPSEVTANNQMIINNLISKTNDLLKNFPKNYGTKKVSGMLNNLLDYLKGKSALGKDASSIFGEKLGKEYINSLYKLDRQKYQEFVKKLTQQIQDIQQQIR